MSSAGQDTGETARSASIAMRFDYGAAPAAPVAAPRLPRGLLGTGLLFAGAFLLFYWGNLRELVSVWARDPGWTHGFVVPAFAYLLLHLRRVEIRQYTVRGTPVGAVILLLGTIGQVLFRATGTSHMSNLSMIVILLGAALWVFGWEYLRALWLPIFYLVFAINPPSTLYQKITEPLQRISASLGTWILPLLGVVGERHGTVIEVYYRGEPTPINVEEACSGMRMLIGFTALAVLLAYSTHRPMWQKLTLALCAVPVAIFCNGLRVATIGLLVSRGDTSWARGEAHGIAGFFIMFPVAAVLLLLISWVLNKLFIEVPDEVVEDRGGAP